MDRDVISLIAVLLGPLIGAGAGTFFGLRGALNGLNDRGKRMETTLGEAREFSRDSCLMMRDHQKETRATATKVDRIHEEFRKG